MRAVLQDAPQVRAASRYALGLPPRRLCVDLLELYQPLVLLDALNLFDQPGLTFARWE
jgi:hypothetical protein